MEEKEKKAALRQEMKNRMSGLSEEYRRAAEAAIVGHLLETPVYQQATVIFCYVGTNGEIDTRPILDAVLKAGKILGVPRCSGKGRMEVFRIEKLDELEKGAYGIMEPKEGCPVIPKDSIQLAVVPCLSCTAEGMRLGYGGGYYDRYLEHSSCRSIALCRERMMCHMIPKESHDFHVELVITENEVIFC